MGRKGKRSEGKESDKRGELVWDKLISWIIAIMVLILLVVVYMILSGKGQGYIDYIKNVLRFGR
ncbi:hypothetical protein HYW75_04465 [Candidatus Pacearchaeota archaeon]|nr:hypothetical protein [Candidatus Pacearchaeota archaeon]